jgi:hypothetical protein
MNKDEVTQLIKSVNTKLFDKKSEIVALDFNAFIQFLISFALISHSRPPVDLSGIPAVECIHKMIERFRKATKAKNLSTLLYEDPDAVDPKEHDLL